MINPPAPDEQATGSLLSLGGEKQPTPFAKEGGGGGKVSTYHYPFQIFKEDFYPPPSSFRARRTDRMNKLQHIPHVPFHAYIIYTHSLTPSPFPYPPRQKPHTHTYIHTSGPGLPSSSSSSSSSLLPPTPPTSLDLPFKSCLLHPNPKTREQSF